MKARHKREAGGRNDAAEDVKTKPMRYTADSKVNSEAEEKKRGGAAKKHVGKAEGKDCKPNAGRKPRKSGGGVSSTSNPFSSAAAGTAPPGRKLEMN